MKTKTKVIIGVGAAFAGGIAATLLYLYKKGGGGAASGMGAIVTARRKANKTFFGALPSLVAVERLRKDALAQQDQIASAFRKVQSGAYPTTAAYPLRLASKDNAEAISRLDAILRGQIDEGTSYSSRLIASAWKRMEQVNVL